MPPNEKPTRTNAAAPAPTGWRERMNALRHLPALVKLVWETHRGYTVAIVLLRIVRAVIPLATLWVGKLIIDSVLAALKGAPHAGGLWTYVAIELGIVIVGEALARASSLVESLLGDLFTNHVSVRLMEHAATLDLAQFEDPEFYDHLERARRQTVGRIGLVTQVLGIAQNLLTLGALTAALLAFNPWLLLLLAAAIIPSFLGETHFAGLGYSLLHRWTPQRRQLDYLRYVGASDATAKEVQLFGLAPWLSERYRALSDQFYEENKRLSVRKAFVSTGLSLLGTIGYYGAYVLILQRAVVGEITIGSLTFLAGAFARSRDLLQGVLLSASGVFEQSLYLRDLFLFFDMRPTIASKPGALPVPNPIRQGLVFEDVGFQYAGSDGWAVRHLNFTLRPGERIALVGENGAGKTTLTKLLARLYAPTEGRILLDGVDLADYDLASLRASVGVIFQDFVRYAMRFDENIGVGRVDSVREHLDRLEAEDVRLSLQEMGGNGSQPRESGSQDAALANGSHPASPSAAGSIGVESHPAIAGAAEQSLAASMLPRLPLGYRQMLGRRFENGVDLSGGEWQKVALARAYMRDAQILILDEPTAALDARAEYEVFARFSELVSGRMAVLISHRFSTVRMADRILVLTGGQIVEDGTHEQLVARGGLYQELFDMQAEGYR